MQILHCTVRPGSVARPVRPGPDRLFFTASLDGRAGTHHRTAPPARPDGRFASSAWLHWLHWLSHSRPNWVICSHCLPPPPSPTVSRGIANSCWVTRETCTTLCLSQAATSSCHQTFKADLETRNSDTDNIYATSLRSRTRPELRSGQAAGRQQEAGMAGLGRARDERTDWALERKLGGEHDDSRQPNTAPSKVGRGLSFLSSILRKLTERTLDWASVGLWGQWAVCELTTVG